MVIIKKKLKPKLKLRIFSKRNTSLSIATQKKVKKPLLGNVSKTQRVRLEKIVFDLNKTQDSLGSKIKQQTDELIIKDKQLKQGTYKQHRAEEQIHIRTKAMDATADGIFIIDAIKPNFLIIYANQAYYKMIGYTKGEILGQNYFLHYGPYSDPRILEDIKMTIQQGKSFHGEMLHFRKNGEKFWDLLRITPVRDNNGTVTHYVGTKTDITLMRQRDLELKEQREELLHVTRVGKLAEFVSSLAHEISQPLTAILSYAQAAQRIVSTSTKSWEERGLQLHEIHQHIINDDQRASEVIRRLRSLLKKSVPEMKPIDINSLIKETVVLITVDLNVRNNVLKTELEDNLPIVYGDRIQLQQVLLNLISNSFDAMEENKGSREMLISTSHKDPELIKVAVKDSGCGIPAKNIPKLFEHFFTSKTDGLGMGLSISRSIVEDHGGSLSVENNSDKGATFYFTIPIGLKDSL
jgi:two-component system, LuxR family, sensor kinase FixL